MDQFWYDRQGNAMTSAEYRVVVQKEADGDSAKYKRVASTYDKKQKLWVSTVLLGIDHRFGQEGPPIIFETMVFKDDNWAEERYERYTTIEEALEGHKKVCKEFDIDSTNLDDIQSLNMPSIEDIVIEAKIELDRWNLIK